MPATRLMACACIPAANYICRACRDRADRIRRGAERAHREESWVEQAVEEQRLRREVVAVVLVLLAVGLVLLAAWGILRGWWSFAVMVS